MFGTAAVDDGKMPPMITSQDEKSGTYHVLLILKAPSPKYSASHQLFHIEGFGMFLLFRLMYSMTVLCFFAM